MKHKNTIIALSMMFIIAMTSCIKEDFFHKEDMVVEEGLPANIELSFKSQENTIVTRAERDSVSENRVNNVYLFIFDSQGNVHSRKFCTPGYGLTYLNNSTREGRLYIETLSLNKVKIFGIANVTVPGVTSTAYSITKDDLDAINSFTELENTVMRMKENSVERYAIFMMAGLAEDENGNTTINIPGTEGGTSNLDCSLMLKRTDAKVKFIVTTDPLDPAWQNFSFTPKTWCIRRVPRQTYLLERESGDYDGDGAEYFTSYERPFETLTTDPGNSKLNTGGSFVFYMPENRKTPKNQVTEYGDRDAWNGKDALGDRIFTNADENSTYAEITGLLSYNYYSVPDNEWKNMNGDVRFIIHLGNTGTDGTDMNNYDTDRNTFYTYNVKIRGVKDIIVEVEKGQEDRPGYEGDVVTTDKVAYVFDSHYDRCLITINPSTVGEKIYWSINTPFSRGTYEIPATGDTEVEESLRDYRWIKFAVNREYGEPEGQFVKYPGDQNYNDPYPMTGMTHGIDYDALSPYYTGYPNARLLDINQLMQYLKKAKADGVDEELTISVFVDEYLYFKNPITGEEDNKKKSLWKLTSDKQDRIIYLIVERPMYSHDDNSSTLVAQYSFRQRSIRTIFNVDKPELETAWGLESVMETERLAPGDVSQGSDTRNGRANCLKWLVGKKWTDIVNVSGNQYQLKGDYNNAAYACLLRNRDLNGNNEIDANEVRWYLASIDQLTDIYIGEYALDAQSYLYPANPSEREEQTRWHYTSSSSAGGENSWILWAEEGASRGGSGGSIDDNGVKNTKFSYRCVRNLGLSLDHPETVPEDLVEITDEGNGFYLIDMTNMNVKARRTSYVTELPNHDERSDINRPYAKFRVHKDCFASPLQTRDGGKNDNSYNEAGYQWINRYSWEYYQTHDPSPEGYRIPNQRELLIMTSRLTLEQWPTYTVYAKYYVKEGWWNPKWEEYQREFPNLRPDQYICQTAFSMWNDGIYKDYTNDEGTLITRQGFLWNTNGAFYLQNNKKETGWIRPVQDVQ